MKEEQAKKPARNLHVKMKISPIPKEGLMNFPPSSYVSNEVRLVGFIFAGSLLADFFC